MSKLLQGRLPFVVGENVPPETFNRTVRLLEISLDSFDPDSTPQFTAAELDEFKFQAGDVIWNTTVGSLQVYTGSAWVELSSPSTSGVSATGGIGTVQVITGGSIVVTL